MSPATNVNRGLVATGSRLAGFPAQVISQNEPPVSMTTRLMSSLAA